MKRILLVALIVSLFGLLAGTVSAKSSSKASVVDKRSGRVIDSRSSVQGMLAKSLVRGGIVYKHYCISCHGEIGTGNSRSAKLYGRKNLIIRNRGKKYFERIIRKGGEAMGESPYMPMWEDELSKEQIKDVVAYLTILSKPEKRGQVVFRSNCILCHGIKGDGHGRASVLYNPRPSDLTHSDKNKDYKRMIVTQGGAAMGRSSVMPIWGEQLTEQEINDVVEYIHTLVK